MSRCASPLARCIGRVVVGIGGSRWFGGLVFGGNFCMAVGVAVLFPSTWKILTVVFPLNLNFG